MPMLGEPLWVPAAKAVGALASSIAKAYIQRRDEKRMQVRKLNLDAQRAIMQIDVDLRIEKGRLMGQLARVNIQEIALTAQHIEQSNLTGPAYAEAMSHLEMLSQRLIKGLEEFGTGEGSTL